MNNNNLIPITSTAQAREMGRKGGIVRSKKKSESAKLREIRKRLNKGKVKSEDEEWLFMMLEDPDCMALEILIILSQIKKEATNFKKKLALFNAYIRVHKLLHGKKNTVYYQEPVGYNAPAIIVRLLEEENN
ncbi:hypothetical protein HOD38_05155 [archaeon]|jgi:hypothetical protein|nr:hypothetical protein [archaeon]MBT4397628.1 hypothetical protein [archaeon]MBT4441673.1 hypothetical protein [archaeon]